MTLRHLLPGTDLLGKSRQARQGGRSLAEKLFPSSCLAHVCKCIERSAEQFVYSIKLPVSYGTEGSSYHPRGSLVRTQSKQRCVYATRKVPELTGNGQGEGGEDLYQVAFCFSFQLFPRLVQDGRDHTEEGERLPRGPESKETWR